MPADALVELVPDDDPGPDKVPSKPVEQAKAGLTGAALLAVVAMYPYKAPTKPDPVRRAVAMAPALRGVDKMSGDLATLPLADSGGYADALDGYIGSQGWRLDPGESVAWAGESAAYAEAADQDDKLLEWQDTGDENECESCAALAEMPPAPLADWPGQPGDGATECNVGCRCSLVTSDVQPVAGDTYDPAQLYTADQSQPASHLADSRAEALHAVMPNAAYLG